MALIPKIDALAARLGNEFKSVYTYLITKKLKVNGTVTVSGDTGTKGKLIFDASSDVVIEGNRDADSFIIATGDSSLESDGPKITLNGKNHVEPYIRSAENRKWCRIFLRDKKNLNTCHYCGANSESLVRESLSQVIPEAEEITKKDRTTQIQEII